MKGYKRLFLILFSVVLLVALFSKCMEEKEVSDKAFAGEASCQQCHQKIYDMYVKNAHHNTSGPATKSMMDSLMGGNTVFKFNDSLTVKVEQRNGKYYQVAYFDGKETLSRSFDVVLGSGEKAFTFGYWEGKTVKQLPLSFFTTVNSWANSPGFPKYSAKYDRVMGARCFQCHSSFVEYTAVSSGLNVSEELKEGSIVYGLDCERCHGPAGKHVQFQQQNPDVKQAKFIKSYKTLTRAQRIDACGVCHSGNDMLVHKSTFSFLPGDDLKDFYAYGAGRPTDGTPDVHGNQQMMLQESQCYIKSKEMDCGSCHNVHESVKGNLTIYSQRCMSCHQTIKHTEKTLQSAMVKSNCIDCHMPKKPSKLITFQLAGKGDLSPYMLRSHKIAVYNN